MADQVPADWRDRVINATLVTRGAVLMGGDAPPGQGVPPQGFSVAIQVDEPAEAERIFHALLDGGRATMPLDRSGPRFKIQFLPIRPSPCPGSTGGRKIGNGESVRFVAHRCFRPLRATR